MKENLQNELNQSKITKGIPNALNMVNFDKKICKEFSINLGRKDIL